MQQRHKVFHGALKLSVGQFIVAGCSFLRNVICARILTKEDFGTAATFALIVSLLELTGKMAVDRMVVQSRHGEDPAFVATAHSYQALFGLTSAVLILLLAWPAAQFFNIPHTLWAFQLMAVIPLVRGFSNMDVNRKERELNFGPVILVDIVPDCIVTLAAWPLAMLIKDYRVLVWLLLLKVLLTGSLTHALAERRYRLAWDARYAGMIYKFTWPLLINGFLLFGAMEGDRVIVGNRFSMADLGMYSLALSLTVMPGVVFIRILSSVMLPLLARAQSNQEEFQGKYDLCSELLSFFSILMATSLIVGGEAIAILIFGKKYAGAGVIIGVMAVAQAYRLQRMAPSIAAMSLANTRNNLVSNIYRGSGLAIAALLAYGTHCPMVVIAFASVIGEFLACAASMHNLRVKNGVRQATAVYSLAMTTLIIGLAALLMFVNTPQRNVVIMALLDLGFIALSAIISMALYKNLRREFIALLRGVWMKSLSASVN